MWNGSDLCWLCLVAGRCSPCVGRDVVYEVIFLMHCILSRGTGTELCWVTSHCGHHWKETSEILTKQGAIKNVSEISYIHILLSSVKCRQLRYDPLCTFSLLEWDTTENSSWLRYRSNELLCEVKSPLFGVCGFRTDFTNLLHNSCWLRHEIGCRGWGGGAFGGVTITSWPSKIKRFWSFSDLLLFQKLYLTPLLPKTY